MDRRTFLIAAGVAPVVATMPRWAFAQTFDPQPGRWRTFELVTRVEIPKPASGTRAWVPVPVVDAAWQKPMATHWTGNGRTMEQITDKKYGASMLYAEWADGEKTPWVEVVSRFQTQDRAHDWSRKGATSPESGAGVGGIYNQLGGNNVTIQKGTYTKLREMSASYLIGPVKGVGDWSISLVGRNLWTFTEFMGWDPETGGGGAVNSNAIGAVADFNYPPTRTFTFTLMTRF